MLNGAGGWGVGGLGDHCQVSSQNDGATGGWRHACLSRKRFFVFAYQHNLVMVVVVVESRPALAKHMHLH